MSKNIRVKYSKELELDMRELHGIKDIVADILRGEMESSEITGIELTDMISGIIREEIDNINEERLDSWHYLKNYLDAMHMHDHYQSKENLTQAWCELKIARKNLFKYLHVKVNEIKEEHCE